MNDEQNSEKTIKEDTLRCTCNDEFVVMPCPVHYKRKVNEKDHFGQQVAVITDLHLVHDQHFRNWEGFAFMCPYCKKESILHFMNNCANCGKPVQIQSKIVTEFMKTLQRPK